MGWWNRPTRTTESRPLLTWLQKTIHIYIYIYINYVSPVDLTSDARRDDQGRARAKLLAVHSGEFSSSTIEDFPLIRPSCFHEQFVHVTIYSYTHTLTFNLVLHGCIVEWCTCWIVGSSKSRKVVWAEYGWIVESVMQVVEWWYRLFESSIIVRLCRMVVWLSRPIGESRYGWIVKSYLGVEWWNGTMAE